MNKLNRVSLSNNYLQRGLSLIELMVAMVVGLILIAGVIEIYVNSKQTYRNQDALSRLQENGRYVLSILGSDIRPAGFSGCGNIASMKINVKANPPVPGSFGAAEAVVGYENTGGLNWDRTLPAGLGADVGNSDVITLNSSNGCDAVLTGNLNIINANIQVTDSCGFSQGDVVMIADCETADVFRIVNVTNGMKKQTMTHSTSSNNSNNLSKLYQTDAQVMKFISQTYFIRNGKSGIPALWVLDNTQAVGGDNPIELVEGVDSLQVDYGVDDGVDFVPDRYVTATVAKTKWDKVVSVRLRLLLRTIDNVQAADTTFNGVTYSGGFLRQEFQATVKLRNRGLM